MARSVSGHDFSRADQGRKEAGFQPLTDLTQMPPPLAKLAVSNPGHLVFGRLERLGLYDCGRRRDLQNVQQHHADCRVLGHYEP